VTGAGRKRHIYMYREQEEEEGFWQPVLLAVAEDGDGR